MSVSLRSASDAPSVGSAADPFLDRPELVERYQTLRALVEADAPDAAGRAILVVGVDHDATEAGTLLAVTFARAGRATALVDADLRGAHRSPTRPHLLPATRSTAGLAEWLSGGEATPVPIVPSGVTNLALVPAGTARRAAGDLFGSERLAGLIPAVRRNHARVVVVAPPLSVAADALPLARHVDAVVLVVSPGRTTGPAAARARDAIRAAGGRILGVVLGD